MISADIYFADRHSLRELHIESDLALIAERVRDSQTGAIVEDPELTLTVRASDGTVLVDAEPFTALLESGSYGVVFEDELPLQDGESYSVEVAIDAVPCGAGTRLHGTARPERMFDTRAAWA